jgi:hypothetical protein
MKTVITSIRLRPVDRARIKKIFKVGLGTFIRAVLEASEENKYLRNKILEKTRSEK